MYVFAFHTVVSEFCKYFSGKHRKRDNGHQEDISGALNATELMLDMLG